ncbi:AAA family ATPase [Acinetobacter haemolyticus]|nr:AAA family ATPase [Acinetobacter haemolyticus]
MELKAFQVENFRSIDQSEWINIDDVTALIGTNESGKRWSHLFEQLKAYL